VIFEFVDVLGRRLVAWGVASGIAGAIAIVAGSPFWAGVGAMFLAWGAVDAALGVAARLLAERSRRRTIGDQGARDRDTRRIRVVLLANAGLDVLYVALGAWLAASAGGDAWQAGVGVGIGIQGGFLFLFDLLHARWVPQPGPLLPAGVALFAGPGHEGFRLSRLDDPPSDAEPADVRGALLVHGFAGSPKELRGLAAVLASNGWLVEVPRLPGHGADFGQVADYRAEDWLRSVEEGAATLRDSGATRLLVAGHSVGGSLALATAARLAPDALVLLAPFCWPVPSWQRLVGPVLRVFLPPGFRVFGRVDLADPEVREGVEGFMPGVDLGDPAVAASMRELRVPLTLLEQLFRVSSMAAAGARTARMPVLAIQGLADTVSRPSQTRDLLERLPSPPTYLEVEAGHDLATEASPARDQVLGAVLAFAERVLPAG
jgi:esterase/lipase